MLLPSPAAAAAPVQLTFSDASNAERVRGLLDATRRVFGDLSTLCHNGPAVAHLIQERALFADALLNGCVRPLQVRAQLQLPLPCTARLGIACVGHCLHMSSILLLWAKPWASWCW